jgi:hypothetical protein
MSQHRVVLSIPAAAQHVRYARVLVGSIAGSIGFDLDGVEDIRIATDECCHSLVGDLGFEDGDTIALTIVFDDEGSIRVEGVLYSTQQTHVVPEYSSMVEGILSSVVDHHEAILADGRAGFRFTKRSSA